MLAIALIAAQAGHLVAYSLRFGGAALDVQATGAHWYFLSVAKTALGLAALAALVVLLVIGFGRLAVGRRLEPDRNTPFIRTLAAMYTLQLGVFVVQETVEAMAGGGHLGSAPALMLWGAIGQLPVALAVTIALRWLGVRVRPALAAIRLATLPIVHEILCALSAPAPRIATVTVAPRYLLAGGLRRRGPPISS
jgi:hypothetical protein